VTGGELYLQGPGLGLAISGGRVARGYFRREYGEAAAESSAAAVPDLAARFGRVGDDAELRAGHNDAELRGGHKLARWRVAVSLRGGDPITVGAHVQGPFGLPLVQSLVLEPLAGIAAQRRGLALVPGALMLDADGCGVLLVGGSGAGKTSLAARAIAAGREVLADDRVLVAADACGWRYVRRMRLYPDIAQTAPAAWDALPRSDRAALRAVALLRGASGARFAPPIALAARSIGGAPSRASVAIGRVLLLRRGDADAARLSPSSSAAACDEIGLRMREDRAALDVAGLRDELRSVAARDRAIVEAAVAGLRVERLELPAAWPAARAVGRLAAELGLP
jgi:hypothetical protein